MRVGVHLLPHGVDYHELRDAWVNAEEAGADVLFLSDHFFAPTTRPRDPNLECWTLLAAMAETTSRASIGPLVSPAPFRNANLLADMARTIDRIAAARFILGVGAGWFRADFIEYGYDFGSAASRVAALESALRTIRARLPELNPPPAGALPILVGGAGERKTLRLVAEHADIWHLRSVDPAVVRAKNAVLDEWCEQVGRDRAEIERACGATPRLEDPDALAEAGASLLTLTLEGPNYDFGPLREALQWRDGRAAD